MKRGLVIKKKYIFERREKLAKTLFESLNKSIKKAKGMINKLSIYNNICKLNGQKKGRNINKEKRQDKTRIGGRNEGKKIENYCRKTWILVKINYVLVIGTIYPCKQCN